MKEGGTNAGRRASRYAFRLATGRLPSAGRAASCCCKFFAFQRDTFRARPERRGEVSDPGRASARRAAERDGAGRLRGAQQLDPESRRDDHQGVTGAGMDPRIDYARLMTRRHFFGRVEHRHRRRGAGAAARGPGAAPPTPATRAAWPDCRTSRPRPSGSSTCSSRAARRSSICSTTSRSSQKWTRRRTAGLDPQGPAADRHDGDAGQVSRCSRRASSSRSTASPARGSASCCRTRRRSSTTSASSSRCTPRRSITIRR